MRTLEEIEAELLAQSRAQQQPMTLEEIEREMMKNLRIDAVATPSVGLSQVMPPAAAAAPPPGVPPSASAYQGHFPGLPGTQPFPGTTPGGIPMNTANMFPHHMGNNQALPHQLQQMQPPAMDARSGNLTPGAQQAAVNPDIARLLGINAQQDAGLSEEERVNAELERKIQETELAEMKRRKKANKIQSMSRYNDIMTQGMYRCVCQVHRHVFRKVSPFPLQVTRNSSPESNSPNW